MEQLLHYVWKHKLFPLSALTTTIGQDVEVIDPGLHNSNAGPDFFNAKVRINGTLWVGNVELHTKASEWFAHHHDRDTAYNNVVLHVVEEEDNCQAITEDGQKPPQLVLPVPQKVKDNYEELLHTDAYPPCYRIIPNLSRLLQHSWMSYLQTERLQQKTEAIEARAKAAGGSWEQAFFTTLARNFGFGVNGDAFETWAMNLPLDAAAHHRDDPFQIEALFFGQAGLLNVAAVTEHRQLETAADAHFQSLSREYTYLAHKFNLTPIDGRMWRFLRLRPQNFPYIRIAQLVNLYCSRQCSLSLMANCAACCLPGPHPTGTLITPSGRRASRTTSSCRRHRRTCLSSTPWCPCSTPMGGTPLRRSSATAPSPSSNSSRLRTTPSCACGNSVACRSTTPATRKRSFSSNANIATKRNVSAAGSGTNI